MNSPTHHDIVIADSRSMEEVEDKAVHLVVTSPPYWQLKDYEDHRQIGFTDSYEEYINNINIVWNECYRVLHPGCRLCVNIGDQFAHEQLRATDGCGDQLFQRAMLLLPSQSHGGCHRWHGHDHGDQGWQEPNYGFQRGIVPRA